MELYNDILCVSKKWLIDNDIISETNYNNLHNRKWIRVVRRGSKVESPLIAYDSLPARFRELIEAQYGDPRERVRSKPLRELIQQDNVAYNYYSSYKLQDGRTLDAEIIQQYVNNASVLNAVIQIESNKRGKGANRRSIWGDLSEIIERLRDDYGHNLPTNSRRLRERYHDYKTNGYDALIHKGYCNNNSRKVHIHLERLILSLYAMKNKPYVTHVLDMYLDFLHGAIDVIDITTGEVFEPNDFRDKRGHFIKITQATVWNYVNNPKNRVDVDRVRSGAKQFNDEHRPHHHRHSPYFSFSKISLDDRDLPRKLPNGKRVKAYYAYDVTSGCCIGASYSRDKDTKLFVDCIRDMFRFIDRNGFGMPMEAEVEHHLVNTFKDDMMKAGSLFPFVRWCNPGNSQEKRAEHGNKVKKYGFEKRYQQGIGRFYAKNEANRVDYQKVFDSENNNYKEKRYDYEELVADDRDIIDRYNNSKHPDEKLYKGMTRMDVLKQHVNPNLADVDRALLAKFIGVAVDTSLRRSQYVRVQYRNYMLPDPIYINKLEPNNYAVTAYYMPVLADEEITEVFLYQNDSYICKAELIQEYNESQAEFTDEDQLKRDVQIAYVDRFNDMVKAGKDHVTKVQIIEREQHQQAVMNPADIIVPEAPLDDWDQIDLNYKPTRDPLADL